MYVCVCVCVFLCFLLNLRSSECESHISDNNQDTPSSRIHLTRGQEYL